MNSVSSISQTERRLRIEFPEVDVYLREDGILVQDYKMDIRIDMSFALKIRSAMAEILDGGSAPTLILVCPGVEADSDVRAFAATKEGSAHKDRVAIVCNSLAHRILGNFFINVQRPYLQTKMFSEQEKAIKWLKSF